MEVTALEALPSPSSIGQNKFDGYFPGSLLKVINSKVKLLLDLDFHTCFDYMCSVKHHMSFTS